MLVVKFSVIVVDAFKGKFTSPLVAPILMLIIHCAMLLLSVYATPYTDKRPDLFSLSITFANVFNWTVLLIFAAQIRAPSWVIWLLLGVNLLLPLLSFVVGAMLNRRKRRRNEALHKVNSVKHRYRSQKAVDEDRRRVERYINEYTLRFISHWTRAVIIACLVGGELIFIGTFAEGALSPVTPHTASSGPITGVVDCYKEEYARAQEFIGFGDWRNFTASCCCMSRANATDLSPETLDTHVVELWACHKPDGGASTPVVYKERQRRDLDPGDTISPVRGFCETHFRNPNSATDPLGDSGAVPVWNPELERLGVWTFLDDGSRDAFYGDFW